MARVDLNSDLGESFGRYTLGLDKQVIPLVTSVNVACGMHAGDPVVMRRTVKLAADAGIAVGAHPGYPDLQGFGRRNMALSPDEGYAYVLYQVGALAAFCRAEGVKLAHVKPHGQLYNRAAVDAPFAQAIAQAVADFNPDITLVALAGGELARAGKTAGLQVAQEFFADRNYTDEGPSRALREKRSTSPQTRSACTATTPTRSSSHATSAGHSQRRESRCARQASDKRAQAVGFEQQYDFR